MLYGRIQEEGDLLVHQVFSIPSELSAEVTTMVFRDNDILPAATSLQAHPKYVRALARSSYTSYMNETPPTVVKKLNNEAERTLHHYLNAVKADDSIESSTKDIRGFCVEYMRCVREYRQQAEVFRKSKEEHDITSNGDVGITAVSQGFKAVLLQRYIKYLLAALTHAARVAVMRTIPLAIKEKGDKCRVIVDQARLEPKVFLEEIEKELEPPLGIEGS